MTSLPIRDPIADHLITPHSSTLVLIDYQATRFSSVRSMDPALLLENIVSTVKVAAAPADGSSWPVTAGGHRNA